MSVETGVRRAEVVTAVGGFGTILVPVRGAADFRVCVCAETEGWSVVGEQ